MKSICVPCCGPGNHCGSSSPHSDSGTLGFQTGGFTKCPGGLLTLHIQLTMSTEQWPAGPTDISGRQRRSYARLVPPTANPEPQGERGSQMQNSVNTMPLETRDCTLTFCSRICAANSAHLFQEEYPERKTKSTSYQPTEHFKGL